MSAVPMGLRLNIWSAHPALKRGANNHCAYGAVLLAASSSLLFRERWARA